MADLARVKRNVAKMAGMNAPIEDIDGYIASEGTTVDAVRAFKSETAQPAEGMAADDPRMEYIRRAKANVAAGTIPAADPAHHPELDQSYGGGALNTTAGINEGLYGMAGLPVDLAAGAMNLGIRGVNAATGSEIATIDDPFMGSGQLKRGIGSTLGAVAPVLDPRNTKAVTTGDRILRSSGEAAGSSLAGAGLVGTLSRANAIGGQAAENAANILGRSNSAGVVAGEAVVSGAAGAGASAAGEAAPERWKPLASLAGGLASGGGVATVGLGLPRLGREAVRAVDDYTAPMRAAGRERLAAETLRGAASDPGAFSESLTRSDTMLVPGSKPTAGQLSGDMGVLGLERGLETRRPVPFMDRRTEQNAARREALAGIQPTGAPGTVAASVRDRISQIESDADSTLAQITQAADRRAGMARDRAQTNVDSVRSSTQADIDAARQTASADLDATMAGARTAEESARLRAGQSAQALGTGMTPEDAGAALRDNYMRARDAASKQANELWAAVDPERKLVAGVDNLKATYSDQVANRTMSERPPEGEEAEILGLIERYDPAMPFVEVKNLRSRISDEMRESKNAGRNAAYARLTQLRGAVERDLNGIIEKQVSLDDEAVRAGSMRPEDTIAARIERVTAPTTTKKVYAPSGQGYDVDYHLVEADDLVSSNLPDGRVNPRYPAGLQPRDRTRAASDNQITTMSRNLQPERLGPSTDLATGAPIIGPDNVIESGNGRVAAISRAYGDNGKSAQAYRDYLAGQGYAVEGMRKPVLVRRRLGELDEAGRSRLAQEANSSQSLAMSASEQGATDASRLTPEMLSLYKGGDLSAPANRDFARAFLGKVADKGQEGAFATADGTLSLDGARRMQTALLSAAYDDPRIVSALADEGDENIRAFGRAMSDLSGDIARLRSGIKGGDIERAADLAPAITEAAGVVQRARAEGVRIPDLVAQADAFNPVSQDALRVLRIAYGNELSGRLSREKLNDIMRQAVREAEQQTSGARLFGEPLTAGEILDGVMARYGNASQAGDFARGATDRSGDSSLRAGEGRSGFVPNGSPASRGVGGGFEGAGTGGYTPGGRGGRVDPSILERPPLEPNFDADAKARLNAATRATREMKETFHTRALAPIGKRPTSTADFDMKPSVVAARVFKPGSDGADALAAYRRAVGTEEANRTIEGYAVDRLRRSALRPDGTFDPAKVASWRRAHSDALRMFPELDARIQDAADASALLDGATTRGPGMVKEAERRTAAQVKAAESDGGKRLREAERLSDEEIRGAEKYQRDRIARATRARNERLKLEQVGIVGDLLKVSTPEDVVKTVGSIFGRKDAASQMIALKRSIGSDAEGQEGLRKAVADFVAQKLVGNTEAGTSGQTVLKSDQYQTFVRQNKATLQLAGFTGGDISTMERIAADLQRANRSNVAVKLPGRSNTAQDTLLGANGQPTIMGRIIAKLPVAAGAGAGFASGGGLIAAVAGGAITNAITDMRLAGLATIDDILVDAMLNPARARLLLASPSRETLAPTFEVLGKLYRRAAAASVAASLEGSSQ
jgi:hypothetical protein